MSENPHNSESLIGKLLKTFVSLASLVVNNNNKEYEHEVLGNIDVIEQLKQEKLKESEIIAVKFLNCLAETKLVYIKSINTTFMKHTQDSFSIGDGKITNRNIIDAEGQLLSFSEGFDFLVKTQMDTYNFDRFENIDGTEDEVVT